MTLLSVFRSSTRVCNSSVTKIFGPQYLRTVYTSNKSLLKTGSVHNKALFQRKKVLESINESVYKNFSTSLIRKGWTKKMAFGDKLWTTEKIISVALLAAIPCGIGFPNKIMDYLLATLVMMHSHWAMEAVALDYIRPVHFGPYIPKASHYILIAISGITLAGLYYFIYKDIGISLAVRQLWAIKHNNPSAENRMLEI